MNNYPVIFINGVTAIDTEGGNIKFMGGDAILQLPASMLRSAHGEHYHQELQYLALLSELVALSEGDVRDDRTGTGTYSVFGRQMRFNLSKGEFPLLTTKKVHFKSVMAELAWMLRGDTNIETLNASIWDEWADDKGNLGPVYGQQWRSWQGCEGHIDQMRLLVENLKANPTSRRHVVTAWNVADLDRMALHPCHCLFQFYVDGEHLDLQLYQRSADIFLGVPFNIASYAALLVMVAQQVGLKPREFIHTFGDLHLYSNHVEQAKEQLSRTPLALPTYSVNPDVDILEPDEGDLTLTGYLHHEPIAAEVSV